MWIANDWKEYEVIDTSCGEKLERWGKYTLVRPDPQVIWDTPKISRGWKNMNAREFDSCIIKIVRAGRIKPVLFLSSFSLYYLVIFSDM